jgi:hypothetical protein
MQSVPNRYEIQGIYKYRNLKFRLKLWIKLLTEATIAQSVQSVGYGLDDRGVGVHFAARERLFDFTKCPHLFWVPASCPVRGHFFPGKCSLVIYLHLLLSEKNTWNYTSILIGLHGAVLNQTEAVYTCIHCLQNA